MKKIIYFMIVVISIFLKINVLAEQNKGKLYELYYKEAKVNVFAKDVRYDALHYYGIQIVSSNDNEVYYCIEPEVQMALKSEAVIGSHTIYEGYNNITKYSRIKSSNYDRISLLAYYGYGYKGNGIDHTDKKWYGITQVLIWKAVREDVTYKFLTGRYGKIDEDLYKEEIKELEYLVKNHNVLPNFNEKDIKLEKGQKIAIKDTNNVLNSYKINLDNDSVKASIKDNTLYLEGIKEGNVKITFTKDKVTNNFRLYRSGTLQNIVSRGNISFKESSITLSVYEGVIKIKKVDETNNFNDDLKGTKISLYDENRNHIKDYIINNEEEIINVPYGKYYVKETKSSKGYIKDDKEYEIIIDETVKEVELVIKNEKIKGNLEIRKKDYSSNNPLSNVMFHIYDINDNLIYEGMTDDKGILKVCDLDFGKYYIKEIKPSKYYKLNEEVIYFEVLENDKLITIDITNERYKGSLKFVKIDSKTKEKLPNAKIKIIYKETNEVIFDGLTDNNGEIILKDINAGEYIIKEIQSPNGYILSNEEMTFEIDKDGMEVAVCMENEKIEIPNTKNTTDNNLLMLMCLIVLIFISRKKKKHEK